MLIPRFALAILFLPALCSCDNKQDKASAPTENSTQHEAIEQQRAPEQAEPRPATAPSPAQETTAKPTAPLSPELQQIVSAAERGDAVALCNLGLAYAAGEGIPADAAKAADCYHRAAETGNAAARFNLARCYALGEGVEQNPAAFIEHCTIAAKAGFGPAEYTLGCAYRDGLGVPADMVDAARWLQRAAMQGNRDAEKALKELSH